MAVQMHNIWYDLEERAQLWAPTTLPTSFFVDSLLPEIWLPMEACQALENSLGIIWDEPSQYYLLNDATHDRLLRAQSTLTFTISGDLDKGVAINITLPYSALDLQLTSPLVAKTTYYFPVKRAKEPSQYLLGRTFLQDAHIVVDYDRGTFNLGQAIAPPQKRGGVHAIPKPSTGSSVQASYVPGPYRTITGSLRSPGLDRPPSGGSSFRSSGWAGIGVGIFMLMAISFGIFMFWRRGYRIHVKKEKGGLEEHGKPELEGDSQSWSKVLSKNLPELDTMEKKHEFCARETEKFELETSEQRVEADGKRLPEWIDEMHEMCASENRISRDMGK